MAADTGGTFTDLVVEGLAGGARFFKRPTTPDDPVRGLIDVVRKAAEQLGTTPRELLGKTEMLVHGTTRATNAVVENAVARTAFLTTEGHRDILLIREGGGRAAPLDYTQRYPDPYVPRRLTFEIRERVGASGAVRIPLDERTVLAAIEELKRERVEALAVCLLWSVANPAHENRVGELLDEHLPGVPFTLSHRLNPTLREYRRASSAAIDASLKPLMSRYLNDLEQRLRLEGFGGRLLILASTGGVLDAGEIARTPIRTIGSGPAAAPVAGRHYAARDSQREHVIVTDAGGTTFDVSLIRGGQIPWTREAVVKRADDEHITGFPSVDVRSIGAGGGSIAWVDAGGLLHVGPQSAGADPGPVCWGRGGTRPTVTDACVALGYIDPSYFLGGEIAIDREAAAEAIIREVGEPLGMDVLHAAAGILHLACERMVTAIETVTLKQGIDPRTAVMIGGGGGAGLYAVSIARRLGTPLVIVPPVSAALSAAGALLSELRRDFSTLAMTSTASFDFELANRTLAELRDRAREFIAGPGAGSSDTTTSISVEARYPDQVWEIEVPLDRGKFESETDVEAVRQAFHKAHDELFAVTDPESPVEIVAWRMDVRCVIRRGLDFTIGSATSGDAPALRREAFFADVGLVDATVRGLDSLEAGRAFDGPAFIDSPVTTIVLHPGATAERLPSGSVAISPGASRARSESPAPAQMERETV